MVILKAFSFKCFLLNLSKESPSGQSALVIKKLRDVTFLNSLQAYMGNIGAIF